MTSWTEYCTQTPNKPLLFDVQYLRNHRTLDIGVLGYIGIVWPKEHSPEVRSFPPGTPCIYSIYSYLSLPQAVCSQSTSSHLTTFIFILVFFHLSLGLLRVLFSIGFHIIILYAYTVSPFVLNSSSIASFLVWSPSTKSTLTVFRPSGQVCQKWT